MSREWLDDETSVDGKQSLKDNIMDAGMEKFTYSTSTSGTGEQKHNPIDVYGPINISHYGYSYVDMNFYKGQIYHHD